MPIPTPTAEIFQQLSNIVALAIRTRKLNAERCRRPARNILSEPNADPSAIHARFSKIAVFEAVKKIELGGVIVIQLIRHIGGEQFHIDRLLTN